MSGLRRVMGWFDQGKICRPGSGQPDFVDLARAKAHLCGVTDIALPESAKQLAERIGPADHLVFVLIDGMGVEAVERAPAGGFLQRHLAGELHAIFPSTTATSLTSQATGHYPCLHAAPGWWVYLEEVGTAVEILPFRERFLGPCLTELGATPDTIFPLPSILPRFKHEPCTVTRDLIADSEYTRYAAGDTPRQGYEGLEEGLALAIERLRSATGRSYTYWYYPFFDGICHEKGVDAPEAIELLARIDEALGTLASELGNGHRMVVSADHGLVNVPEERALFLQHDDPLMETLVVPPTGEPTVPIFHLRNGSEKDFVKRFNQSFGAWFALLSAKEVEDLRLFGPEPLCPEMRRRIGDYLALAAEPTTLNFVPEGKDPKHHPGVHAGLSSAEMRIPFILA